MSRQTRHEGIWQGFRQSSFVRRGNSRRTIYQRRLRIEPLEERRLLSITVSTLDDLNDGDISPGHYSLREAVANAAAGETIDFSVTGIINLTNVGHVGELLIDRNLTIAGPGAKLLAIRAFDPSAAVGNGTRAFNVDDGNSAADKTVTIGGLTLSGGDTATDGGAISNSENLTLQKVVISDNHTAGNGGGVAAIGGQLTVVESTIAGNGALGGGGIFCEGSPNAIPATIVRSTISGNSAIQNGGGILSNTDLSIGTTIVDSTISGNAAGGYGGGIYNFDGLTTIRRCTITANTAPAGKCGGVAAFGDEGTRTGLESSIVAGNAGDDARFLGGTNSFQSDGYNLIGTGNAAANFNQSGDQTGVANPGLAMLAANGGPTMTHAPLPGSPAIDKGHPLAVAGVGDVPLYDQRGIPYTRVFNGDGVPGARIDIGAFELQPTGPALPGDYNRNSIVDAADYTAWRDTVGGNVAAFSGADGSGNGIVDAVDHEVWKAYFGQTVPGAGGGAVVGKDKETGRQGDKEGAAVNLLTVVGAEATAVSLIATGNGAPLLPSVDPPSRVPAGADGPALVTAQLADHCPLLYAGMNCWLPGCRRRPTTEALRAARATSLRIGP